MNYGVPFGMCRLQPAYSAMRIEERSLISVGLALPSACDARATRASKI